MLYEERDLDVLGEHFHAHMNAMTNEDLRSKSDIAAELAHRDVELEKCQRLIRQMKVDNHYLQDAVRDYIESVEKGSADHASSRLKFKKLLP